jgi:YVTN family beta-propeller protein
MGWLPARPLWPAIAIVLASIGTGQAGTAFVSNEKSNTVTVIDTATFAAVKTIKVGQRPRGIEVSKDGKHVYVAVGDDDTIEILDTKTHEIIGNLPSGPDPELFTQSPDGKSSMSPMRTTTPSPSSTWSAASRSATSRSASSRRAWG